MKKTTNQKKRNLLKKKKYESEEEPENSDCESEESDYEERIKKCKNLKKYFKK